jgi:hypothetical protein
MRLAIAALAVALPLAGVGDVSVLAAARQSVASLIIPGQAFGPIRETTTRADLERVFPGRVRDALVEIGEGICTPGAVVLGDTADRLDIAWQDNARGRVAFVRTTSAGGRWRTRGGVGVGTTLADLERLAGAPITFNGFGWDYGGGTSWAEDGGRLGLALTLPRAEQATAAQDPREREIYGDQDVRSDHPLVRRLRIVVGQMTLSWGAHRSEVDCS